MDFWQALLLGGLYWLANIEMMYTFYWQMMDPLFLSVFVGLLFGNVPQAMIVGAYIQPMYLAFLGAGGTAAVDKAAAGIIPTAAVLSSGLPMEAAVALAVPVGLLMAQLHTVRRIVAATWVHMADGYAKTCNTRGIYLAGLVYHNLFKIVLLWLPMTLILYFGTDFTASLIQSLPAWLLNGLSVVSGLLPAMGFAMTVNVIGRPQFLPFFIGGFFLTQYTGVGMIPLALIGLFLAYLHFNYAKDDSGADSLADDGPETSEPSTTSARLLTKKDVTRTYLLWWYACEQSNSFERLQTLAFCVSLLPVLKKLYGHDSALFSQAIDRHLTFFNTEGIWGALIHGIVLAMEEQRAMGLPVADEAIQGIKVGLMGPLAGIGDTIDGSTIHPLITAAFIPAAAAGHWWAGILPFFLIGLIEFAEGLYFCHLGFQTGTRAALSLLRSGQIRKIITFASVLGLFMMGGLSSSFVSVQTPLAIPTAADPMYIQTGILDAIAPGLLSISAVFAVYTYLKRGGTMLKATFYILGIGLVLGSLGILGALPVA